jgi:hypothetical protein
LGEQDLLSVGGLHDPCGSVDGATEHVVIAALDHPQMESGAHAQRDMIVCGQTRERLLQDRSGVKRVQRVPESGVHPVAGHFHDHATVSFHRLPRQGIVFRQGERHPLPLLLPQAGAALDIGEKKGGDPGCRLHA